MKARAPGSPDELRQLRASVNVLSPAISITIEVPWYCADPGSRPRIHVAGHINDHAVYA